jgi:CSLREA domain-containing protein
MRRKGNLNHMIRRARTSIYETAVARGLLYGALLLAAYPAALGRAATFAVNSTGDAVDAVPGNGACGTAAGTCTLRAAIQEANALAGADTINVPEGTYFLITQGSDEDAAASGDLDLTSEVTINGTGTSFAVISGGGIDRVFDVLASGVVTLSRLTIQNGKASGTDMAGGGIRNAGSLTLVDISIRNNTVQSGDGGGIANLGSGRMQLTNVTISGNLAADRGGGIANDIGGTMQLVNVTLTDNGALTGGDIDNLGDFGAAQLVNTIVANSRQGSNCTGSEILSLGHNIDDGHSCLLVAAPSDLADTNPGLLGQPSGAPVVYALVPGSPAIDAGDNGHCPDTDQRGEPRPTDGNADGTFTCDIGAYEAPGPLAFTPTVSPSPTATQEPPTATVTGIPAEPTLTPTPILPTITPGGAAIRLGTATGNPGEQVMFDAVLDTGGAIVGTAQNDITFDSFNVPIAALENGTPDCVKNPDLADKTPGFSFLSSDCTAVMCTMRAFLFQFAPISPIADGSTLYTCSVNISPEAAPGEYPLAVSRVSLSNPLGTPVAGAGVDGKIVVVPRPSETPTPSTTPSQTATPITCVGDCDHSNDVTIDEVVTMVNIALGNPLLVACPPGDADGDGIITVNEIIVAVNNSLHGCQSPQPAARPGRANARENS